MYQRWHKPAQYFGALGLFVSLGLVTVSAQQPDFTGVWTNYVAPGGRGGGRYDAGIHCSMVVAGAPSGL